MTETVTFTIPSHPKYLYVVRSALYPVVLDAGFKRREARKIILAIDEACSNIIKHAYGGDTTKTINVTVSLDDGTLTVQLRDFGTHVDPSSIAPRKLEDVRPGGLGTHCMGTVFDSVEYRRQDGGGTLLVLSRKRTK
jgi:anti-sigma regulatory factor (Ser/Thr protein kinase)